MRVRAADLARDRAAFLGFIMGSQDHEHAVEPNRRLDPPVAEEHLAKMLAALSERPGAIFVAADEADKAIGWGVVIENEDDVYVVAEERRHAYIAELFVDARVRGMSVMQIGVLPGNMRAHDLYHRQGYADYGIQLRKYLR